MPSNEFDGIVRISLNRDTGSDLGNQVRDHLTKFNGGTGPFERIGTALYSCHKANGAQVERALSAALLVLQGSGSQVDFLSINIAQRDP